MALADTIFDTADQTGPGYYNASRTALLLLDFHAFFVEKAGGPAAPAALAVADELRIWAHARGIPVIHALIDTSLEPTQTCKDAERFAGFMAALRTKGGEEAAELVRPGASGSVDVTFLRQPGHVSALKSPNLEEFLQQRGIVSLLLAGLSTSGCVMRTAFAASDAEYVVTVISDACADPADGVHDFAVQKLFNNRGYVMTAAEFQQGFARATDRS